MDSLRFSAVYSMSPAGAHSSMNYITFLIRRVGLPDFATCRWFLICRWNDNLDFIDQKLLDRLITIPLKTSTWGIPI